MPSFQSFLQVAGREYEITYFDFSFQQQVDHLGRPASKVQGGIYNIEIHPPGSEDNTLYEWMANPTKRYTGQVLIKDMNTGMNLKVVRFIAAYCVDMTERFDGTTSTAPLKLVMRISPEKVILDGIKHDNVWPNPTDGDGVMVQKQIVSREYKREIPTPKSMVFVNPTPTLPIKLLPPICDEFKKAGIDDKLKAYVSGPPKKTTSEEKVEAEAAKKIQFDARMAIIKAARENLSLRKATNQFKLNNKAVEMAKLSDNIYQLDKKQHYKQLLEATIDYQKSNKSFTRNGKKKDAERIKEIQNEIDSYPEVLEPPTGWKVDKRSKPGEEPVFVVYKSTFDPTAAPVLTFRGTDKDVAFWSDWETNLKQTNGFQTS